jgi:hypothetical protein
MLPAWRNPRSSIQDNATPLYGEGFLFSNGIEFYCGIVMHTRKMSVRKSEGTEAYVTFGETRIMLLAIRLQITQFYVIIFLKELWYFDVMEI